jgi:hypothetical protein
MVSFSPGKVLGLPQKDMLLQAGMTRQQYNRLETKGNPRLDNLELLPIPKEKLVAVKELLEEKAEDESAGRNVTEDSALSDGP